MKKKLYVIIVSAHNLPEYKACLKLKPDKVVLIASTIMRNKASLLSNQLIVNSNDEHNKKIDIDVLPSAGTEIEGNDYIELNKWLNNEFKSYIAEFSSDEWHITLNFTGGTKLLSALIRSAYSWQEEHYMALGRNDIQIIGNTATAPIALDDIRVSPDVHASLYHPRVKAKQNKYLKKCGHNSLMQVASALMKQHNMRIRESACPWQVISELIKSSKIFFPQNVNDKWHLFRWEEITDGDRQPFIDLAYQLNSAEAYITVDDNGLTFPTLMYKESSQWRNFIKGDWFELIMIQWLAEFAGESEVVSNIVFHEEADDEKGREADILVSHKGNLWACEVKVDIAKSDRDIVNQQKLLMEKFGGIKGAFLLAPSFYFSFKNSESREAFLKDCNVNHIKPCLAVSPRHVAEIFTGKNTFPINDEQLARYLKEGSC